VQTLDLAAAGRLTFEAPDEESFPCLPLAREAAKRGGTAPCTLNAANEVAVHAFLGDRLRFLDIPRVIEGALDEAGARAVGSFDDLYEADADARRIASALVERLAVGTA
jgi:1-deoxy-D-xylulose-5-phosphate reductoisomerase